MEESVINKITDEVLYKYMPIVDQYIMEHLEEKARGSGEDLAELKKKEEILQLAALARKKAARRRARLAAGKIIAAMVIITLITSAGIYQTQASKDKLIKSERDYTKDDVSFTYITADSSISEEIYSVNYVPEGYELEETVINSFKNVYIYSNGKDTLVVDICKNAAGGTWMLNGNYTALEELPVNYMGASVQAEIYTYEHGNQLAYFEVDKGIVRISGYQLGEKEIALIIESIKINE